MNNDITQFYNAEDVLRNKNHNLEMAILETTGPFQKYNAPKETQDYIKFDYSLVAMALCSYQMFLRVFKDSQIKTSLSSWSFILKHNFLFRGSKAFKCFPFYSKAMAKLKGHQPW